MSIRDAKVANRVLGKIVEAFTERFVINFLPERKQPFRRLFSSWFGLSLPFLRVSGSSFLVSPHIRRLDITRLAPSTPIWV
jgi:hypothetical protein